MAEFIDLTGKKFGRLTAIRRSYPNTKDGKVKWLCKCECGEETIVERSSLRRGNTRSCGCLVKFKLGLSNMRQVMNSYKCHAKKRNLKWDLTEEQFKDITKQNCYYCGAKPNNISNRKWRNGKYIYNGIDRIDNTKGYTLDNVVPSCFICNRAKDIYTLQEFKDWIKRIYDNMYGVN